MRGTYGTPEAGARSPYIHYVGPSRGKLNCVSVTYSTREPGTCSPHGQFGGPGTYVSAQAPTASAPRSRQTGAPSALAAGAPAPRPPWLRSPPLAALPPPPRMLERRMAEWRIAGTLLGSQHPSGRRAPVRPCSPLRSCHVGSILARRVRVPAGAPIATQHRRRPSRVLPAARRVWRPMRRHLQDRRPNVEASGG